MRLPRAVLLYRVDDGSCNVPVYGCTDACALSYDSAATVSEGRQMGHAAPLRINTCLHQTEWRRVPHLVMMESAHIWRLPLYVYVALLYPTLTP